tara:strand:- start:139305 stop:140120 length:816 start_codon:yes stop_codon:yes gene_type:complete
MSFAEQTDITFIVAGKTSNNRQHPDGSITVLNYHFFAEIFRQEGGVVAPASLLTPLSDGAAVEFEDSGYALEVHGGRYGSEAELEAGYPDGAYVFNYTTPSTGALSQVVHLTNTEEGGSGLPAPPAIHLFQAGKPVAADQINPDIDLRVSWSPFVSGSADPLGITDDLVFVIMADCDGVRRAHSGRPFEGTPFLTYADSDFVIRAEQLLPENVYQLSVEHAVLDTSIEHEVIAYGTFATTTFLEIHATGAAATGEACPKIRKQFDAGQQVL